MNRFVWFWLLMAIGVKAQSGFEARQGAFDKPEAVFPGNWHIVSRVEGDLNKDAQPDAAFLITDTKVQNRLKNEALGASLLDLNPRFLVVLLSGPDGKFRYDPVHKLPLMTAGDTTQTCLEDPLAEGGMTIEKGLLKLSVQYFYSCGGWTVKYDTFVFRHQQQRFELIGLESHSYSRASGETTDYSYNFSTGKVEATQGGNQFDETVNGKTTKKKLKALPAITFDRFRFDTEYETQ